MRAKLESVIGEYLGEHDVDGIWGSPIVGFADARSDGFRALSETVHPDHLMPGDILPGATVVVSIFVPFDRRVSDSNRDGDVPSDIWASAYRETNSISKGMLDCLRSHIIDMGYHAEVPFDTGRHNDSTYSVWSQRHIARLAGLGTFGMNNMLITSAGCCGRFYSLVTDLDVPPDRPPDKDRCLYRIDGSCGVCTRRCIAHALGPDGFDRMACDRVCRRSERDIGEDVCGKCTVGIPCAHRDPSVTRGRSAERFRFFRQVRVPLRL